jgi:hypothetical protein
MQQQPSLPPTPADAASRSRSSASDAAAGAYAASDLSSVERAVIKSSTGPDPFPGVPVLPPRALPEPGQVLLRYDVEEVRRARARGFVYVCWFGGGGCLCGGAGLVLLFVLALD